MQAAWKPVADLGVPIVAVRDNPRHSKKPIECLEQASQVRPHTCAAKEKRVLAGFDAFQATAGTVEGVQAARPHDVLLSRRHLSSGHRRRPRVPGLPPPRR